MDTGLRPIHGVPTSPVVLAKRSRRHNRRNDRRILDCKACEQIADIYARPMIRDRVRGVDDEQEQHEAASAVVARFQNPMRSAKFSAIKKSEEVLDALANYFERKQSVLCSFAKGVIEKSKWMPPAGLTGDSHGLQAMTEQHGKYYSKNENLVAYQGRRSCRRDGSRNYYFD